MFEMIKAAVDSPGFWPAIASFATGLGLGELFRWSIKRKATKAGLGEKIGRLKEIRELCKGLDDEPKSFNDMIGLHELLEGKKSSTVPPAADDTIRRQMKIMIQLNWMSLADSIMLANVIYGTPLSDPKLIVGTLERAFSHLTLAIDLQQLSVRRWGADQFPPLVFPSVPNLIPSLDGTVRQIETATVWDANGGFTSEMERIKKAWVGETVEWMEYKRKKDA